MLENLHDCRGGSQGGEEGRELNNLRAIFHKSIKLSLTITTGQSYFTIFNECHTAKFSKMGKNGSHACVCMCEVCVCEVCVCVMLLIQQRLKITTECNKLCPRTASATFPAAATVPAAARAPPPTVPVPAPALA